MNVIDIWVFDGKKKYIWKKKYYGNEKINNLSKVFISEDSIFWN